MVLDFVGRRKCVVKHLLGPNGRVTAKLIKVPGLAWDTDFHGDDERRAWHERKMASKVERPAAQMARFTDLLRLRGVFQVEQRNLGHGHDTGAEKLGDPFHVVPCPSNAGPHGIRER